jgi:hypothetical protein
MAYADAGCCAPMQEMPTCARHVGSPCLSQELFRHLLQVERLDAASGRALQQPSGVPSTFSSGIGLHCESLGKRLNRR